MDHYGRVNYYRQEGDKKILGVRQFSYDLGGVRTGQKIQGATTPRLTCNFKID